MSKGEAVAPAEPPRLVITEPAADTEHLAGPARGREHLAVVAEQHRAHSRVRLDHAATVQEQAQPALGEVTFVETERERARPQESRHGHELTAEIEGVDRL